MRLPKPLKRLLRASLRAVPPLERRLLASAGYRLIDRAEVGRLQSMASGWKRPRSAAWQQAAYDGLLDEMAAGRPRGDFVIAAQAVDETGLAAPSLLEVGCGGGYHSAIFAALCTSAPHYSGCDYSEEMVESARRRFPGEEFSVADTTALPHRDASFDIVFDGVSLMHIPDFCRALSEIARVARSHAILHCVPVFDDEHPTQYLFKYAYGEPVTEAIHNRRELEQYIVAAGLVIERSWDALRYDVFDAVGSHSHGRTYLCRKAAAS